MYIYMYMYVYIYIYVCVCYLPIQRSQRAQLLQNLPLARRFNVKRRRPPKIYISLHLI